MDLQEALVAVGFTEYEARVYIALLHEYPDTGYQISKRAGVPRSMVYEALGRLHARGAVLETQEKRATLYRPLPPDVLLNHHEQRQRQLIDGLRQGLGQVYTERDEDRVWAANGQQAVLAYAVQMIDQVERELFMVLDDIGLAALHDAIVAACERGVEVGTLLTGSGELAHGQVAYHPPLESELHELTGTLMVVADGQETLIAKEGLDVVATITRNHNLVMIARQFVWMELFTQRIYAQLGPDLLVQLSPADRRIFESLANHRGGESR